MTIRCDFREISTSRSDEQLSIDFPNSNGFGQRGKNGFSKFTLDFVAPRLLLSPSNYSFIIERKDFDMSLDGKTTLKRK